MINFEKMNIAANVLTEIKQFQKIEYQLNEYIIFFIKKL